MRGRAFLLGLAAVIGAAAMAQQPDSQPPEPQQQPDAPAQPEGLAGRWTGSAKFQTDGATLCRYEGGADPPALILELRADGTGRLRLDLGTPAGTSCPAIALDSPLSDTTLTPTTAAFKDAQGREWNLALQAGVLRGLFSGSDGSGELSLQRRRGARAAAAKPAAPSPSPSPEAKAAEGATSAAKGPGLKSGALGFIGANIVGLGALLAVTQGTQDDSEGTSTLVCSPRVCIIGVPGEPCDCSSTITTGQDCGQTESGVPIRGACALPNLPCQALLSCNNGVCEDRLGSCPF